jgi:hypothetical protein
MATATDIMEPVLETIHAGQDVYMKTVQNYAEFGQHLWPSFFSASSGEETASPAQMIDTSFDFARRVLDIQEEFCRAMWAAAEPMFLKKAEAEPAKSGRPAKAPAEKTSG